MQSDAATEFAVRVRAGRMRARVDAVTAEVASALGSDGVRPLLLRGAAVVALLYEQDSPRLYMDADVLVAPPDRAAAERCLARLGFERALSPSDMPGSDVVGTTWRRPNGDPAVDLHTTVSGAGAPPEAVWAALSEGARPLAVGGVEVDVPSAAACALIVALHAAHHGPTVPHPLDDLACALARLDGSTWAEAAELAARIDATAELASGLALHPAGTRIAAELGLADRLPPKLALKGGDPTPGAVALEVLASAPGARAKLGYAARKLVPTPRFVEFWFPRARRGRRWLVVGYLWRPLWLLWRTGPALRAWRRARVRPS